MSNAVKRYRKRRQARLDARGYRADEDDGQWVTTDGGNHIHLSEDGTVDKGNPFVVVGMGAPKGKEMPKSRMELKENNPLKGVKDVSAFAEALRGREDKDCIFGGYYKVAESGGSLPSATFYNPYTGEHFTQTLGDTELDISTDNNEMNDELQKVPINNGALWCWNRSNGIPQKGDTVEVVAGRTLDHGTRAKVNAVYDGKFGKYAYLDNGEKIQAKNVAVVDEDGSLIRSHESKEAEELKKDHERYRSERKEREKAKKVTEVTQADVEKTVGKAKTRKAVVDALKKAGYTVQDNTDDSSSSVDVRAMRPDGTYVRVYKAGKEMKFQDWKKQEGEKTASDHEINETKYYVQMFLNRHKSDEKMRFEDLDDSDKYWYVLADTANNFLRMGVDSKKAWTRAMKNAESWEEKGYKGYNENIDDDAKKVLGSIIDGLR